MKVVFFDRRNTLFNSEFNTNSEYVILFQKYFEQKKMALSPLVFYPILLSHLIHIIENGRMNVR